MTLASRLHDAMAAIAAAINARSGLVGASAYDIYVINGGTLSQTLWLRGSAPREMTKAQRLALTGSDLWERRRVTDTDTGITWLYSVAGGYWFIANGTANLTYNGATINVASGTTVQVPFDTVDNNDDTNLFTLVTGSGAGLRINRGGLYRVHGLAFVGTTDNNYHAILMRLGGGVLRETDVTAVAGRIAAEVIIRVTEGSTYAVNVGVYLVGTNPQILASSPGYSSHGLTVERIGD